jgi:putative transposase
MDESVFSEGQIIYTLPQLEAGTPVAEVCRKLGITGQTFSCWNHWVARMGVS